MLASENKTWENQPSQELSSQEHFTRLALSIPEIVQSIQDHLDRSSLSSSLRVSRLWHRSGHHLIWQTVDWDNTLEGLPQENFMLSNAYRINTLRCMFHSQACTSKIDSSPFLQSLLYQSEIPIDPLDSLEYSTNHIPKKRLQRLFLRGHFDLQRSTLTTLTNTSSIGHTFITFNIPTLARLEIRPTVNTSVDIHLILDSAIQLNHLVICSHGKFIDSLDNGDTLDHPEVVLRQPHSTLSTLIIQHLKISRTELETVATRCPNLVEFQSICSPGSLWKERPPPPQVSHHAGQPVDPPPKSLVRILAAAWPKIKRFNIGLQQGGFNIDSIHETLTCFPRLESFGLPALDCTKVTMETIKTLQVDASKTSSVPIPITMAPESPVFLTSLYIMNVSSNEKISQAILDFLCWTPYLKEFYASNTTLYLEQMLGQQSLGEAQPPLAEEHQGQHQSDSTNTGSRHQWACTGLEKLVARFAHLPWRNLSDPPKRCKELFSFMKPLQKLKYLSIKEGLMLEAGREYDGLAELSGLEEVVFSTCYPIPIKPVDMAWLTQENGRTENLKRVTIRRQKSNSVLDKEMNQWFQENKPNTRFSFETTECYEDEL